MTHTPNEATATKPPTAGLPDRCPPWCIGSHQQAVDEGCSVEDARVHVSDDTSELLPRLSNPFTGHSLREGGGSWRIELRADHAPGWWGRTYVRLEVSSTKRPIEFLHLDMTTGEARDLAAALLRWADTAGV